MVVLRLQSPQAIACGPSATFRAVLRWGKGARPLYFCIDQLLDVDCPRKGALTWGKEALFSQGHWEK